MKTIVHTSARVVQEVWLKLHKNHALATCKKQQATKTCKKVGGECSSIIFFRGGGVRKEHDLKEL